MSSSTPNAPLVDPSETPQLRRLSSQLVKLRHDGESLPKPNPTNGLRKPSASADRGPKLNKARTKTTIRRGCIITTVYSRYSWRHSTRCARSSAFSQGLHHASTPRSHQIASAKRLE